MSVEALGLVQRVRDRGDHVRHPEKAKAKAGVGSAVNDATSRLRGSLPPR